MRYTPSAGDTIFMINGDQIEVISDVPNQPNKWLINARYATLKQDEYSYPVVAAINPDHIVYAIQ